MTKRTTPSEKEEALATLRQMLPPGSTVYTILRHVSRSGMRREISAVVVKNGEPQLIDYLVGRILDHGPKRSVLLFEFSGPVP